MTRDTFLHILFSNPVGNILINIEGVIGNENKNLVTKKYCNISIQRKCNCFLISAPSLTEFMVCVFMLLYGMICLNRYPNLKTS